MTTSPEPAREGGTVHAPAPSRAVRAVPERRGGWVSNALSGAALAIISILLVIPAHRLSLDAGGVPIPLGLILGALFQLLASVALWATTGSRLPTLVFGCVWGLLAIPFAGAGRGGGLLMPATIAGQAQYSGLLIQAIGVFVPLAVVAALTVLRARELMAQRSV